MNLQHPVTAQASQWSGEKQQRNQGNQPQATNANFLVSFFQIVIFFQFIKDIMVDSQGLYNQRLHCFFTIR
ncbi:MAG TPA: hypothetical protein DCY58_05935 [Acetobacterium sp.]|nr:hypothetical protein [Acetobacterium sp.]